MSWHRALLHAEVVREFASFTPTMSDVLERALFYRVTLRKRRHYFENREFELQRTAAVARRRRQDATAARPHERAATCAGGSLVRGDEAR